MRRRISLALLALAIGLGVPAAAWAASASDPIDTLGKLDLRSFKVTRSASEILTVTVRTWDSWQKTILPATGSPNRLFVLFNTDADGSAEYKARIVNLGGSLVALLSGQGQQFEPIPVTRPSDTQARFVFPADVLVDADEDLGVAVRSIYQGGLCSASCIDRAPNTGWVTVPA